MNSGTVTCLGLFGICSIFGVVPQIASAQHTPSIVVDGSLAPARPLGGPNYMINADLGKQMGGNLFHSFTKFGLLTSETAIFNPPTTGPPVTNVIGRVTGGMLSSIEGTIQSNIPSANLYLINPSGIVFGPTAKLNVSGSFHASTADYIKMSDGARFQATNPGGSTLSAAAPAAFGFLNATPGMITVNGSTLEVPPGPPGQTLGLVGGPVSIQGDALSAPGGTIRVTSVAGPGEVPAAKRIGGKPTVAGYGPVNITNASTLDVGGQLSGGSVFIRAGALTIDGSEINGDNFGSGSKGRLVLRADGDITLSGGTTVHADAYGSGTGGVISVKARNLSISNALIFTQPGTQSSSTGSGGDISVKVTDALSIDGASGTPLNTGIQTQALPGTTGTPGNITVSAGNLSIVNLGAILTRTFTLANAGSILVNTGALYLQSGGQINSETRGRGAAGTVTVNAAEASITNIGEINAVTRGSGDAGAVRVSISKNLTIVGPSNGDIGNYTGIGTVADPGSTGNAGSVTVNAGSLSISGLLGQISSSTLSSGTGGDVSVNVAGLVSITGPRGFYPTGIVAGAFPDIVGEKSTGRAGSVAVTAGSLSILDGGEISSTTVGPGAAGDVSANIAGPLSIAARGISPTGILAVAFPGSAGTAGSVTVNAGSLSIVDGGEISSTTFGIGAGGSVSVMTPGPLLLDSEAQIAASAKGPQSGPGGFVMVNANSLTVSGGAQIASTTAGPGKGGDVGVMVANGVSLSGTGPGGPSGITASAGQNSSGPAGDVVLKAAGAISLSGGGQVSSATGGSGTGGTVQVTAQGPLTISDPGSEIAASTTSGGNAGSVAVSAPDMTIVSRAEIASTTMGSGMGGPVDVTTSGALLLGGGAQIAASAIGPQSGPGGRVRVNAGTLTIQGGAQIASTTAGTGNGGTVEVVAQGPLSLSDPRTGIVASATSTASSDAGLVMVMAPQITIAGGAQIASTTEGLGNGGSVTVATPGALVLDGMGVGGTRIAASADQGSRGGAGDLMVAAGNLTVQGGAQIASSTAGPGKGGGITVTATDGVTLSGVGRSGPSAINAAALLGSGGAAGEVVLMAGGAITLAGGAQVTSSTAGTGKGGTVQVMAQGPLSLSDSGSRIIASATSTASGNAGSVMVGAPQITLMTGSEISSTTAGTGAGGSVDVRTPGALVLDGLGIDGTRIAASADQGSRGGAGDLMVAAGNLTVQGGAQIASSTAGPGKGGDVAVKVANGISLSGSGPAGASEITTSAEPGSRGDAGQVVLMAGGAIALSRGAQVTSSTAGAGKGGTVRVTAQGPLSLNDPGSGIIASATLTASGAAGSVGVMAPQIAILGGAEIASTTAGTGAGGSVAVTTPGSLLLDGMEIGGTRIAASADQGSLGEAGDLVVAAGNLTVQGGAQIASSTAGPGNGGSIAVIATNGVTFSGVGPIGPSGISAAALSGSGGAAGEVVLMAGGAIALSGGAQVTSSTSGTGKGGTVQVMAQGPLSLSDPGSGIIASTTSTASGAAGSVGVMAPQIAILGGAEIASTTAGTGAGGSVAVTTPGALLLNGMGAGGTQIAASAIGTESGPGGPVTVQANSLIVEGGAQIASSTAGRREGGNVSVTVASDITLPDRGPQITAQSTGGGDAGSITVSAVRLLMNSGAAISTEAEASTASGGNITLKVRDFLYLVSSKITTSVKGETGNGGNIAIDPQFVVLNHSSIIAEAVEGHGGDITINAGQFVRSADSVVSASSERGVSGTVEISGPRVDVNGALVVLSSELYSAVAVLRSSCAAQATRPQSSLVEKGRGGLPQDPEATLPALYHAGRDVKLNPERAADTAETSGAVQTTARLTMRCS